MPQQTTLNLAASHPVRSLNGLARAIALPAEYAPERFPSFPALERTAVMSFNQPATLNLPASTPVKMAVCRQATYPVWADFAQPGWCYTVGYTTELPVTANVTNQILAVRKSLYYNAVGNQTASPAKVGISGCTVGGPTWAILGFDQGCGPLPFTYVPANATVTFVVYGAPLTPGATYRINYDQWDFPGQCSTGYMASVTIAANNRGAMTAALTVVGGSGVWLRPTSLSESAATATTLFQMNIVTIVAAGTVAYTPSTADAGTVAVTPTAPVMFMPLVSPVEFANSALPWNGTRMTAAAVLGTNVSQVLNKAGTVLAGRVNPFTNGMWTASTTSLNALHPAEKAWLPLETGIYTYCPPSTDMASFWDYDCDTADSTGQNTQAPMYRLDNDSLQNVMILTAGSVAESLAVTASWSFEFRTNSALFQIALSSIPIEVLHQAQLALSSAGFFFENPTHKSILDRVIAGVRRFAPPILKGLTAVNPVAGQAAQVLYRAYGPGKRRKGKKQQGGRNNNPAPPKSVKPRENKQTMKPTNARDSGIIPKRKGGIQIFMERNGRKW